MELRDRGPNADRGLRLTFRWVADQSGVPVSGLWLVANYLRRVEAGVLAVVRFDPSRPGSEQADHAPAQEH